MAVVSTRAFWLQLLPLLSVTMVVAALAEAVVPVDATVSF
jgi:hypothetical protein